MTLMIGAGGPVKRHTYPQNAEMNVTPLVDVMLVLLVIFMVAAPLATVTVPLDLPVASATPSPAPQNPVTVSIQRDGMISLGDKRTELGVLARVMTVATKNDLSARILIRCDQQIAYGRFFAVMKALQDAGFHKIGLVAAEEATATGTPGQGE